MATYLMFGSYSPDSLKEAGAKRTDDALKIIHEYGGEYMGGYAVLGGDADLVVIVDLPDAEHALQTSVALTKFLGISFRTTPALTIEDFDKLME